MSVDLLRERAKDDFAQMANEFADVLVGQSQAPLDVMRFNQGVIAGIRMCSARLDERYQNLHAIG